MPKIEKKNVMWQAISIKNVIKQCFPLIFFIMS